MLATRAISPAGQIGLVSPAHPPIRPRHPLLAVIGPALDTAFGLESPVLFPDEIVTLLAALDAALQAPAETVEYHLEAA